MSHQSARLEREEVVSAVVVDIRDAPAGADRTNGRFGERRRGGSERKQREKEAHESIRIREDQ
jgi:hypothetical protein